jgi:hypothetical protein
MPRPKFNPLDYNLYKCPDCNGFVWVQCKSDYISQVHCYLSKVSMLKRHIDVCQKCYAEWEYGMNRFHRHHIKRRNARPDLIHDVNNIKLLCERCHMAEHNQKM